MIDTYLFTGIVFTYLAGAAIALILNKSDRLSTYVSFLGAAIASVFGIIFSLIVVFSKSFAFVLSDSSFLNFGFFADRLSAFFILVISIAVFAVSIYSIGYMREYFGKKNIGYLGFLYNIFILSMIFVVTASNAIMFLIVWELMSVISYLLVVYEHEKPEVRKAGFIYIVMTHIGTGFIILSFLIFASTGGSFDFETFRTAGTAMPPMLKDLAFLFALVGFGAKAGIVPLHIWLPYAHPAAPSNVSALMSGVMIKTAIYMLIRISFDFLGVSAMWWGFLVLAIGTISAILGIAYAVIESDIKRMLAFSSIENMGIILLGMGASMIFFASGKFALSALAATAALYHLLNHSIFKGLLFMGAGSIIFSTHTKNIEKLGGLIKKMPVAAGLFLIGILSISALPPFSGFVSEWLTLQSLLLGFGLSDSFARIVLPISAAALALTGALAAFCFLKTFGTGFLALARSEHAEHAKEANTPMLLGMGIFALLSVLSGILPLYILPYLNMIVEIFAGANAYNQPYFGGIFGIITMPAGAISVSTPALLLLMLILVLIPFITIYYRNHRTIYETWGCGQPVSTARNEYTATAFSKPVQIWLGSIYHPASQTQVTYSASPFLKNSFKYESRIEQIFENIYTLVAGFILDKSRAVKIIQIGSIHAYLAYIFGVLVVLFMFIIAGGS